MFPFIKESEWKEVRSGVPTEPCPQAFHDWIESNEHGRRSTVRNWNIVTCGSCSVTRRRDVADVSNNKGNKLFSRLLTQNSQFQRSHDFQ